MSASYLDKIGLKYFYDEVKKIINKKISDAAKTKATGYIEEVQQTPEIIEWDGTTGGTIIEDSASYSKYMNKILPITDISRLLKRSSGLNLTPIDLTQ